ncbi:MAG: hypothetical protein JRH16_14980 [Deltaproteobacteria bacterium]|nr:hypothetical protein [Deltaproteobacteria bacterium]MBW2360132.1 hypothetical protein [Deltaproteobacteria bacterium]
MQARMLCTDCGVTAHADTLLEGSDRIEAAAWVLGAAVGWLYCARRHWLRTKVCAACGSCALVREAWAAAAVARPFSVEPRVIARGASVAWPRRLSSPRDRLRAGAPAAVLVVLFALAAAAAALAGVPLRLFGVVGLAWSVSATLWAILACLRRYLAFPRADGSRAWDAHGRRLRIEIV